jgi:hypothetical protein
MKSKTINRDNLSLVKKEVYDFYKNTYCDKSINSINFLVDTPGHITKVITAVNEDVPPNSFSYIITQESAHDAAPSKSSQLDVGTLKPAYTQENIFCEIFDSSTEREYAVNKEGEGFKSVFSFKFKGLKFYERFPGNNSKAFTVDVEYNKNLEDGGRNALIRKEVNETITCRLNDRENHPTNIPYIKKTISPFYNYRNDDSNRNKIPADKGVIIN